MSSSSVSIHSWSQRATQALCCSFTLCIKKKGSGCTVVLERGSQIVVSHCAFMAWCWTPFPVELSLIIICSYCIFLLSFTVQRWDKVGPQSSCNLSSHSILYPFYKNKNSFRAKLLEKLIFCLITLQKFLFFCVTRELTFSLLQRLALKDSKVGIQPSGDYTHISHSICWSEQISPRSPNRHVARIRFPAPKDSYRDDMLSSCTCSGFMLMVKVRTSVMSNTTSRLNCFCETTQLFRPTSQTNSTLSVDSTTLICFRIVCLH